MSSTNSFFFAFHESEGFKVTIFAFGAVAATLTGVGMNLTFIVWGAVKAGGPGVKKMLLVPSDSMGSLNGFLVSFIVAGVVFFGVSLATRPGATETKSLALFFHPSLD